MSRKQNCRKDLAKAYAKALGGQIDVYFAMQGGKDGL